MASATLNYSIPYPQNTDSVDVAGDIQSLAEHLDNNLSEIIADNVGLMVSSNTENGISVSYDDADNTLDFDINDFYISLIGDVSGSATVTNLSNTSITVAVQDDSHTHTPSTLSDLDIEDISNVNSSDLNDDFGIFYNLSSSEWVTKRPSTRLFVVEVPLSNPTISATDAGATIELTSSSPTTVTILNDVTGEFSGNETVSFIRKGSGTVTFVSGSGVVINSLNNNYSISGQYGMASIYRSGENAWILTGDLS